MEEGGGIGGKAEKRRSTTPTTDHAHVRANDPAKAIPTTTIQL